MKPFTIENIKEYKDKQGIYALILDEEVVYVGQSTNLYKRLRKHFNSESALKDVLKMIEKEKGRCNRTKQVALYKFINIYKQEMKFIILKETDELNKYEEQYITMYKPRFNYKGVDVPY